MKLIEVLNNLPMTFFKDYGNMIPFDEICKACKKYKQNNHLIIAEHLKNLSSEGLITLHYNKARGFEDIIIGATVR